MEKETYFFKSIEEVKESVMELFAKEYGDNPSMDELIKFRSIDKINSLTARKRLSYINRCNSIANGFSNKDAIDYILTLSKLYGDSNLIYEYFDNTDMLILLEIFNHISINEYNMYLALLNDFIYMRRLNEKVNNITRNQNEDRRLAIIRDICSQFVAYLQKYKEENKGFSNISRNELSEVITSFVPRGISTPVHESINDNPIKR